MKTQNQKVIEFNNNNIWEIEFFNDSAGEYIIVCRNRKGFYPQRERIDETQLNTDGGFNFKEWKDYYCYDSDPIVYYAMYVLGYQKIEKIYPTKYVFKKLIS